METNATLPNSSIKMEMTHFVHKVNSVVLFVHSLISICGLFGNILALTVINRRSLRHTSSAVFITYLAIFDSAVLITHAAHLTKLRRNLFLHCSLTYLLDVFTFCANWILVIITLERSVAVTWPFLSKRFCTVKFARRSIYILISLTILFFSISFPIMYRIDKNSKRRKCVIRQQYSLIQRVYQPIVMIGLPDFFLLSNLYTIYALIRRQRQQSANSLELGLRISDARSSRKQYQLTIMLVVVNLAFYLFSTPAMISYISEYIPPKEPKLNELKRAFIFSQITVVLLQMQHATNFIFYCFAGQRFRREAVKIIQESAAKLKCCYHRYVLREAEYTCTTDRLTHFNRRLVANHKAYRKPFLNTTT